MEMTDESRVAPAPSLFLEAVFIDTATAATDKLRIRLVGFDAGASSEPVMWAPLGDVLPQSGDRALVVESDQGFWWVITWIPST